LYEGALEQYSSYCNCFECPVLRSLRILAEESNALLSKLVYFQFVWTQQWLLLQLDNLSFFALKLFDRPYWLFTAWIIVRESKIRSRTSFLGKNCNAFDGCWFFLLIFISQRFERISETFLRKWCHLERYHIFNHIPESSVEIYDLSIANLDTCLDCSTRSLSCWFHVNECCRIWWCIIWLLDDSLLHLSIQKNIIQKVISNYGALLKKKYKFT